MVHRVPAVQQAPDGVHGEERVPRPARTHQHGRGTLPHRPHEPLQSRYNRTHLFQSDHKRKNTGLYSKTTIREGLMMVVKWHGLYKVLGWTSYGSVEHSGCCLQLWVQRGQVPYCLYFVVCYMPVHNMS